MGSNWGWRCSILCFVEPSISSIDCINSEIMEKTFPETHVIWEGSLKYKMITLYVGTCFCKVTGKR